MLNHSCYTYRINEEGDLLVDSTTVCNGYVVIKGLI